MRKKIDHRDRSAALWWDTEYNGAAIYALVDDDGKMYIGRASRLQKRLYAHRRALQRARDRSPGSLGGEGHRLVEAAAQGKKFEARILRKFPEEEVTMNVLRYWECHYYKQYGKKKNPWDIAYNLYNSTAPNPPVWHYKPMNVPIKTVT